MKIRTPHIRWSLLVLIFVAGGLRLWGLGDKSIWHDEAFTLLVAKEPLVKIPQMILDSENHPPLGYLLMHGWMYFGKSAFWLRLPSAIAGILTVLWLFFLGKKVFRTSTAFMASLLFALNGYHLFYSQEVRNYTMGILFVCPILFYGYRLVEKERQTSLLSDSSKISLVYDYLTLYGWGMLALYLEYMAVFPLIFLGVWFLGYAPRQVQTYKRFFLFTIAIIVSFLPWVFFMSGKLTRVVGESFWLMPPNLKDLAIAAEILTCGYPFSSFEFPSILIRIAIWLILALVLTAVVHPKLRPHAMSLYLAMFFLLPFVGFFLLSQFKPIFHPRFLIWFLPALVYLLAVGIMESRWDSVIKTRFKPCLEYGRYLMIGVLIGLEIWTVAHDQGGKLYEVTRRYDYESAANFVSKHLLQKDRIIHFEPFSMMPFRFYMPGISQSIVVPKEGDVPYYLGGTFLSEAEKVKRLDDLLLSEGRIWWIRFKGRSYPSFSEQAGQKFSIHVEMAKSFEGIEVWCLGFTPK